MLKRSTSILLTMSIVGCGILKKKNSDDDQPAPSSPAPKSDSSNPQSQGQTTSGNQQNAPANPAPQVSALDQFKSNIQGQWKTACASSSGGSSKTTSIKIDSASISLTSSQYVDGSCATRKFAMRYSGPYSVGAAAVTKTGGYNMSYQFDSYYVTLYSADAVLSFNLLGQCGMSDWTLGVEKKITSNMPDCSIASAASSVLASPFNQVMVQSNSSLNVYDTDASSTASYIMQKQ